MKDKTPDQLKYLKTAIIHLQAFGEEDHFGAEGEAEDWARASKAGPRAHVVRRRDGHAAQVPGLRPERLPRPEAHQRLHQLMKPIF